MYWYKDVLSNQKYTVKIPGPVVWALFLPSPILEPLLLPLAIPSAVAGAAATGAVHQENVKSLNRAYRKNPSVFVLKCA